MFYLLLFIFALGLGIVLKDAYFLGAITLYVGCVRTYLTLKGRWYEEFVGIIETILSAIVCCFSNMYASAIFSAFVYIPLSIFGLINWKKNEQDNVVKLNEMSAWQSAITLASVAAATMIVSFLLSLIPTQRLAAFDAAGDILNICGIVLITLRYKEGWVVWLLGDVVDLVTWILALSYSPNAVMMIIMSAAYVVLNIWGLFSFIKMQRQQKRVKM